MATRTPITVLIHQLTTTASDTSYTVPANSILTISAATLNNSTGTARTATVNITPNGGSALALVSALPVPASGSAPTTVSGLVGQTLTAGGKIEIAADANAAVNAYLSGYLQQ
jgi:hypothetical protein